MLDQIGPKRVWRELKDQAPYYAKMLPDLPRLLHGYLQQRPIEDLRRELKDLAEQQRQTNKLLQSFIYGAGFVVLAVLAAAAIYRLRFF